MPDYVFYDPNSTPVANRVRHWQDSMQESEAPVLAAQHGWSFFEANFDVTALPSETRNRKVVNGKIVDLDAADLAAIAAANAAAAAQARTEQTQWLKDQLTATNEVLPHVFRALAIEILAEINNRIGGNPRTQSAFLNAVADRANALIDARP